MFEMKFSLAESHILPQLVNTGLAWNSGYINVVTHGAVRWDFLHTKDSWILLVYDVSTYSGEESMFEKPTQIPVLKGGISTTYQEIENARANIVRCFENFYVIEGVIGDIAGGISVYAGRAPSLPAYFEKYDDTLCISWDVEKLLSRAPRVPNFLIIAHRLSLLTPYSVETIFEGVQLLTERSSLIYSPNGLDFHYPAEVDYEADLEKALPEIELIKRLHSYFNHTSRLGLRSATEISGGIDSAIAAYFSSKYSGDNFSLGLLIGDELGTHQIQRRNQLIDALGFKDYSIHIDEFPPLIPLLERQKPHYRDEFYINGFKRLWSEAKSRGYDSIINGQGGDELFYIQRGQMGLNSKFDRSLPNYLSARANLAASIDSVFFAPPGLMARTVYNGFGVQTREIARLGLWPLQPFTMPSIVAPCKRLNIRDSCKKQVLKSFLQKQLNFDLFPEGYRKENFTSAMLNYILKNEKQIKFECKELALIELGLVDADALSDFLLNFFEKKTSFTMDQLVFLLSIEGIVREYGHV